MRRAVAATETEMTMPASWAELLGEFRGCFSAWTFPVFSALASGLVAKCARRSVCGMLVGARLSAVWSHHRAHRFFSHASWSLAAVSGTLARLVVAGLVGDDERVVVAVDDTLFQRRGPKVHGAGWFHDGSLPGRDRVSYANNWVIAAIGVRLSFICRPLALPVGFALICKGSEEASRLEASCRLVLDLASALPGRRIDVVADSAHAGKVLRSLPDTVTWTTRPRSNAALYELAPPRTGKRGRPRIKGERLPVLSELAAMAKFEPVSATRYGTTATARAAVISCLWYRVFGGEEVKLVLVRDSAKTGYEIALISTDLQASTTEIIERYALRWSIEVAIEDAKQTVGVGEARNRVRRAVERTVPFAFVVGTLAVCWYATAGHHEDDVAEARALAPW
jgi:hypothetical protein